MDKDYVSLKVSDGTEMQAYVARPTGDQERAPKGGVIVLQEAFGVNDYIKRVCARLTEQGYLTVAPELFHRTEPGFAVVDAPMETVMPHMQALTTEGVEEDVRAAHEWLSSQEGIGDNLGII